jgi:hypothetical protein
VAVVTCEAVRVGDICWVEDIRLDNGGSVLEVLLIAAGPRRPAFIAMPAAPTSCHHATLRGTADAALRSVKWRSR